MSVKRNEKKNKNSITTNFATALPLLQCATFAFQIKIELNRISSIQRMQRKKDTMYIVSNSLHVGFESMHAVVSEGSGEKMCNRTMTTGKKLRKHTLRNTYIVHQARVMSLVEFLELDAP